LRRRWLFSDASCEQNRADGQRHEVSNKSGFFHRQMLLIINLLRLKSAFSIRFATEFSILNFTIIEIMRLPMARNSGDAFHSHFRLIALGCLAATRNQGDSAVKNHWNKGAYVQYFGSSLFSVE
jgi:hypothetical protein